MRSCSIRKILQHLKNRDRVTVTAIAIAKSGASASAHLTYEVAPTTVKSSPTKTTP
jgi:hypothetical protein